MARQTRGFALEVQVQNIVQRRRGRHIGSDITHTPVGL
jgi:hypothetical protein